MNIAHFGTSDCTGAAIQIVQQYHNVNDCESVNNYDPCSSFSRRTCAAHHPSRAFQGLVGGFYGLEDTTCAIKPVVVQGIVTGACIKGTTTDAAGNQDSTNSSSVSSCADLADLKINVYSGNENCNGQATQVLLKVPFLKCASTDWNSGQSVNEKEACVDSQGFI